MPAFGLTSTRARTLRPGAREPRVERLAGDPLVSLDVLLAGAPDDVVRDRRRGRIAIPAGGRSPIAHKLLVKARLRAARLVLIGGPEARGIGRAHLVAERQLAIPVEPELELRVGEDDAALPGMLGSEFIHGQRDVADALSERAVADQLSSALEVDVLVVALLRLRR